MRSLLALLIFGLSASANATLIQLDAQGPTILWEFATPAPTTLSASLLFDTAGSISNFRIQSTEGIACLGHYDAKFSGTILDLSGDGTSFFSDMPGIATAFADTPGVCNANQQAYFASLGIAGDNFSAGFSYDAIHPISLDALLASTDRLAALLSSIQLLGFNSFTLGTPAGGARFEIDQFSVREVNADVPEPGTLMLLLLGLTGLAMWRRRLSPSRQPAIEVRSTSPRA